MTWEKGRQLASMTRNGTTLSFKYDSSGLRTEKTSGNTTTEYTYVGEKLVSMKSGETVMNFAYGADGSPYGFTYNGTSYFYLLNLQGDIIGIHDASGNVVARYNYDAWGKLISTTATNSAVALSNPLRYRGYVYDTETGLYYLQSRYYDPETCRFINADSLLVAGDYLQGTNMFAYCLNNPVMYSDPTGYMTTEEVIYFSVGVVCCLILLAGRVPDDVAASYMSSLAKYFEYDFKEVKDRLDLLLSSFPTNENWPSDLPYPTEFDESGFTVVADVRFTDEGFCIAYANRIIAQFGNGYTYQGMGSVRIAVELYAHAVAHFMLPELKKTFLYDAFKDSIDDMHKSSNPITVNNDDKRVALFYAAWAIF